MDPAAKSNRDAEPATLTIRQAWWMVAVLTTVVVFSFLDRGILALLVEPVKADLQISDTQMSYLLGFAFAAFYATFGLPIGRMADRGNRIRIITVGLFLWNLATFATGMARSYLHLFLLRMGVGVGEATVGPSAMSIITDAFPRERLATAMSVYATGIYIGAGIATLIGGQIAGFAQEAGSLALPLVGAVRPWQTVFFVLGILGILPLCLLLVTVREPARVGAGAGGDSPALREVWGFLMGANRRTILCHHIGFSLLAFSGYGAGAWIPTFMIRTHGWSISHVGTLLGINTALVGTAGILTGGMLADRWYRHGVRDAKMRVGLITALCWLPTGIAYCLVPEGWMAFTLLIPTTFISSLATGCAGAALQEIMPNRMRGQASAIYVVVATFIGLGLGPTGVALCTDYLFGNPLMLRYSLVIVSVTSHTIAGICFLVSLRPFRESLDRIDDLERLAAAEAG